MSEPAPSSTIPESLLDLTWSDLESWAGTAIVDRGRRYKRRVLDPRQGPDGEFIAWVHGTATYVTRIAADHAGRPVSECTCPYFASGPCKHAVALLLVCLDWAKDGKIPPPASEDDNRLRLLRGEDSTVPTDPDDVRLAVPADEPAGDDWGEEEADRRPPKPAPGKAAKKRAGGSRRMGAVRETVESLSKAELIDALMNAIEARPEIGEALVEGRDLTQGKVSRAVQSARKAIVRATAKPGQVDQWTGRGFVPDFEPVRRQFAALLEAGHADSVVALGEDLWRRGVDQVGVCDDEGETADRLFSCMEIVVQAMSACSLEPAERALWAIDLGLGDEYGILAGIDFTALFANLSRKDWSLVADRQLAGLEASPLPQGDRDFIARSHRRARMDQAIEALDPAGRAKEITPLLEREAPIIHCYPQLVDRLTRTRRGAQARRWAIEGFGATIAETPAIAWELEGRLRGIAASRKRWPEVAAYRALEFFDAPSMATFGELEKACRKSGAWPAVRENILEYLKTGVPPGRRRARKSGPPPWPLPDLELDPGPPPDERAGRPDMLIDIALKEKRFDGALELFHSNRHDGIGMIDCEERIALAVHRTHPEFSIGVWKKAAESSIGAAQVSAYYDAADDLRRLRRLYERERRTDEWESYLAGIRTEHRRKRRLMEILDTLDEKRIIDR